MRTLVPASLVALALLGCDNGKMHLHPEAGATPDSPPPDPWWMPEMGEARNWDIQINAPLDVSTPRAMYVLDVWDLAGATTLDYGDGDPVTVPAGALAGKVAELHAANTIVVCRVRTGGIRLDEPDARKFPGFEAAPPDNPTPPAAGSVIGWSTNAPEERYLDISAAGRAGFQSLIWKRFDLAAQLGCDAIEGDLNDQITATGTGFTLSPADQVSWYEEVARQGHQRELSMGMKGGYTNGLVDQLDETFDWLLVERCGQYDDCHQTEAFAEQRKAVFTLDYQNDEDGMPQSTSAICSRIQTAGVDGIVKDDALSSAFREQCVP